ncbi:unnamed protein product [Macrosiphum euphorbiae]|uniref:THAP-type domain-containing protein n=1 Tax=Macrosiphum euphorbiae TaxID=13131 RepID=A0AAV0VSI1_9HEMI|nr:unnamed protein product [Macrosiphum euphorbiae]
MPTSCCVRGCKSKGNGKIKYFRFPRDVTRRLQWIQALDRENFVPTNNTLICEAHFTTNDYQKRPDLIKLTHTAVPSIFKGRVNEKQNASLKKVMDSGLKSSRMPARKRHSNLSDHTYVLKLPEEIIPEVTEDIGFQKSISPSKCVAHTLDAGESRVLDVSQSNIQTSTNIENPGFKIPESFKKTFQPPEKNWEHIAMIQQNTIHDLRKKVKVLHQKIRRYSSTIETLKEQLDIMIRY